MSGKIQERRWGVRPEAKSPWNRAKFVAAASHPGGIKTLTPIFNELVWCGMDSTLVVSESTDAIAALTKEFPWVRPPDAIETRSEDQPFAFGSTPTLALFSASAFPDMKLEMGAARAFVAQKLPVDKLVLIEDDTPGLKPFLTALREDGIDLSQSVDALLVASAFSPDFYTEFPEIPRTRFIPVGPPRCDFIYDENLAEKNRETRTRLDIPLDAVVIAHFAARGGDQYGETERHATQATGVAVHQLSQKHPDLPVVFIHRQHPGDSQPEIIQDIVNRLPASRNNYRVITHDQTGRLPTADVAAATNLGVATLSLTLTEMALHGALRPEPRDTGWLPLFFLSEGARSILDEVHYPLPTPVRLGAAASVQHKDELLPAMERALFDKEHRETIAKTQEKDLGRAYRFKKGAARATTRAILQIRRILERKEEVAR